MKPACMDDAEYRGWVAANATLTRRVKTPCVDCPMWFAAEMRLDGRCDGTPGETPRPADPGLDRAVFAPVVRVPPGGRYASEDERRAARRESWRESARRYRARRRLMTTGLAPDSRRATVAA